MQPVRDLIDWSLAARVGHAVAGPGPKVARAEAEAIADDFRKHVEIADRLVRDFTGLEPATAPGPSAVLSRAAWIDANLDGIRAMLAPVSERVAEKLTSGPVRRVGATVMGAQVGLLLGYIAQKVLGQYDLLLATGEPGRVYFVGPNIVASERRFGLDERDFRLWIALHEVTHRTQFLAVPWLKDHVQSLIEQYLAGITLDQSRMKELSRRVAQTLAGGPEAWRQANVISMFLSPEQRDAVDRMQALMSVVEGHGNFVMDGVARAEIPSFDHLRRSLSERREQAGAAERAFQRFIALDLKYEQYAVGQQFFDEAERLGGMDAVNAVWSSPDSLPAREELRDVAAWLRRVSPQPRLFEP